MTTTTKANETVIPTCSICQTWNDIREAFKVGDWRTANQIIANVRTYFTGSKIEVLTRLRTHAENCKDTNGQGGN